MPASKVRAEFDEPNLVAYGGLEPLLRLAERCGLPGLVGEKVCLPRRRDGAGAFPAAKVMSLVGGMAAGADSIEDMHRLRHGAMPRLFAGVRAPSTLGAFLRLFSHGHNRQLAAVARRLLPALARHTPLLPGADQLVHLDIDDTVKRTYGYAKQGAGYGYSKVKGLNALLAVASTPLAAPVITGQRLRKGPTASVRGAASFVAEAIRATRDAGASGLVIARMDSAFYAAETIGACRAAQVRFSVTVRMNASVKKAITAIPEEDWRTIKYPQAVWDEEAEQWISDAEIAETPYTAFTSKAKRHQVTARLIVRRVKRLNTDSQVQGQGELFTVYRYHAAFTDSPLPLVDAEADHRRHAIVEQVISQLKQGPLAHLPSGSFQANNAWLTLAVITHNLLRALGCLASAFHARATTATLRDQIIAVPARIAGSARTLTLRLPARWPDRARAAWENLFDALHAPPRPA
jgi:hypothetical protein